MAAFDYQAVDSRGKSKKGVIEGLDVGPLLQQHGAAARALVAKI